MRWSGRRIPGVDYHNKGIRPTFCLPPREYIRIYRHFHYKTLFTIRSASGRDEISHGRNGRIRRDREPTKPAIGARLRAQDLSGWSSGNTTKRGFRRATALDVGALHSLVRYFIYFTIMFLPSHTVNIQETQTGS